MKTYQECLNDLEANQPNNFMDWVPRYAARRKHQKLFDEIARLIDQMFYPHFISYPEEAEFIEALIKMTMAKNILEVGMFSGFTTLHMLRAVIPNGRVTGVDSQKVYPARFFEMPEIQQRFRFVQGHTPEVLETLKPEKFDLVYVDSDHSPEHTAREVAILMELTDTGSVFVFHDCPSKLRPNEEPESGPMYQYAQKLIKSGLFQGLVLPTCDRLDVREQWGDDYQRELLPHMAVLIRR